MVNILSYIALFLLLFSKYLDGDSTMRQIKKYSIHGERNPMARKLMLRYGPRTTMWVIGLLSAIIAVGTFVYAQKNILYQCAFIVLSLIISCMQFAIAHANYTSRQNIVTRFLSKTKYYGS